jgi:hypothetical protein
MFFMPMGAFPFERWRKSAGFATFAARRSVNGIGIDVAGWNSCAFAIQSRGLDPWSKSSAKGLFRFLIETQDFPGDVLEVLILTDNVQYCFTPAHRTRSLPYGQS